MEDQLLRLAFSEPGALLEGPELIQELADELAELGYAADAAAETQDLVLEVRRCRNRLASYQRRLRDLWVELDRWRAGDSSEDSFKKVLEEYRAGD